MSYFEDQEDAWFANNCQGDISQVDPYDVPASAPPRSRPSNHTRSRALLSLARIEEFATWAAAEGFKRETPKGEYEVLRLRWPGQAPLLFFTKAATVRGNNPVHATCYADGLQLVHRWLRSLGAL